MCYNTDNWWKPLRISPTFISISIFIEQPVAYYFDVSYNIPKSRQ